MSTPLQQSPPVETPDLFDALGHARRRHALAVLEEADTPLNLADLAREVLARERGTPLADLDEEAVRRCYLVLYHSHVPKLADAGLVSYDLDSRTVDRSDDPEVAAALECLTNVAER